MFKSAISLLVLLVPFLTFAEEQIENPFLQLDHFPGGYFLMPDSLPHFMGIYMKEDGMRKIEPSEEQEIAIEKRFKHMTSIIMPMAEKIKNIESRITNEVVFNNKSEKDLSSELEQVAKLRRELTELQIQCLNFFKETLQPLQYKKMIQLAQQHQHK